MRARKTHHTCRRQHGTVTRASRDRHSGTAVLDIEHSLRWHDPGRFNGYVLSQHLAGTPVDGSICEPRHGLSRSEPPVRRWEHFGSWHRAEDHGAAANASGYRVTCPVPAVPSACLLMTLSYRVAVPPWAVAHF